MDKRLGKFKEISKASSTLCLAKWTQATINLEIGFTQSCHHTPEELLPPQGLKPSHLHNSPKKIEARNTMLNAEKPPGCEYCFDLEEKVPNAITDRVIKSTDPWSFPRFSEILNDPKNKNFIPSYVEIILDRTCNFSCMYCSADYSSSIKKEMDIHGPYPVLNPSIKQDDLYKKQSTNSKYFDAFANWAPELFSNLLEFRISGGEPLLAKNINNTFELIEKYGHDKLSFSINTNLGVSKEKVISTCSSIQSLLKKQKVSNFNLFISLDSVENQAEYIRFGLNTQRFFNNLELFQKNVPLELVTVMCTFNILSVPSFHDFLEMIIQLKKKYKNIYLDISHLISPSFLQAKILGHDQTVHILKCLEYMKENESADIANGFTFSEISKFKRIVDWIGKKDSSEVLINQRSEFYRFINEYDKRKKSSFIKAFPELERFYKECKKASLFSKVGL